MDGGDDRDDRDDRQDAHGIPVASKEVTEELHGEAREGSVQLQTASSRSSRTDDAWGFFLHVHARVDEATIGWCDRRREAFSCWLCYVDEEREGGWLQVWFLCDRFSG